MHKRPGGGLLGSESAILGAYQRREFHTVGQVGNIPAARNEEPRRAGGLEH